jgi:hypothetical protein
MVRIRALAAGLLLGLAACGGSASLPPVGSGAGNPLVTAPPSVSRPPSASPRPSPTTQPTPTPEAEYQAVEDLEIGDCYDPIDDTEDDVLLAASIKDCDDPHINEVFGLVLLSDPLGAPYPADRDIEDASVELCDAAFEKYVGSRISNSNYGYLYYTPTESTWEDGDRLVMCVIDDDGDPITGSTKGTGD